MEIRDIFLVVLGEFNSNGIPASPELCRPLEILCQLRSLSEVDVDAAIIEDISFGCEVLVDGVDAV